MGKQVGIAAFFSFLVTAFIVMTVSLVVAMYVSADPLALVGAGIAAWLFSVVFLFFYWTMGE